MYFVHGNTVFFRENLLAHAVKSEPFYFAPSSGVKSIMLHAYLVKCLQSEVLTKYFFMKLCNQENKRGSIPYTGHNNYHVSIYYKYVQDVQLMLQTRDFHLFFFLNNLQQQIKKKRK